MPHPIYALAAADYERAMERIKRIDPGTYADLVRSKKTMDEYKDVPTPSMPGGIQLPAPNGAPAHSNVSPHGALAPNGLAPIGGGGALSSGSLLKRLSEASRVIAAAEKYLRVQDGRRTSTEITRVLVDEGVEIKGDDLAAKASRVSAHLSTSDKFDNERTAGGYQLTTWRGAPVSPFQNVRG